MKIVLVVVFIMGLAIRGEKPKPQADTHETVVSEQTSQPSAPSPVTVNVINQPPAQVKTEDHASKSPNYFSRLFSAENLPNIALVIVGIGAILVASKTLRDISEQTRLLGQYVEATKEGVQATRKSAEAALLNAQAVITAERPWVMVNIKRIPGETPQESAKPSWQFIIFNYGKTPGHIVDCKGPKIEFHESPEKLPIPPEYEISDWNRRFLAPNDSMPIGATINPSDIRMKAITDAAVSGERGGRGEMVVYGLIEYTDGISKDTYKTAFCYRHEKSLLSTMGGFFLPCGPRAYNDYT
jgi:hypothetical protein